MIFPYSVPFKRTANWWGGGWYEISTWMEERVGKCGLDWEYMSEEFLFKTADVKTLFLLRWK